MADLHDTFSCKCVIFRASVFSGYLIHAQIGASAVGIKKRPQVQ